jgi:copper resistance protein B
MKRHTLLALALLPLGPVFAQDEHAHHEHHEPAPKKPAAPASSSHVPPDPPSHVMEPMSNAEMAEIMAMDDAAAFGSIAFDRFEWREHSDAIAWEGSAWYGGDYNKLMLKSEGESADGADHLRTELLWDRTISRWWHMQTGVRHDSGEGPSRTWAAFGIEGLAPYWIELEATAYVGEEGRTALRAEGSYDLRFTQRLILQPQFEINLYGKDDPERGLGSGLSDVQAALRLRYEVRREFAPFIGVHWSRLFGETADIAQAQGSDDSEVQFVAGLKVWF